MKKRGVKQFLALLMALTMLFGTLTGTGVMVSADEGKTEVMTAADPSTESVTETAAAEPAEAPEAVEVLEEASKTPELIERVGSGSEKSSVSSDLMPLDDSSDESYKDMTQAKSFSASLLIQNEDGTWSAVEGTELEPFATYRFSLSFTIQYSGVKDYVVNKDGKDYYALQYDFPEGLTLQESSGNTFQMSDGNGGTVDAIWEIVKNDDGTYSLRVYVDKEQAGDDFTSMSGAFNVEFEIDQDSVNWDSKAEDEVFEQESCEPELGMFEEPELGMFEKPEQESDEPIEQDSEPDLSDDAEPPAISSDEAEAPEAFSDEDETPTTSLSATIVLVDNNNEDDQRGQAGIDTADNYLQNAAPTLYFTLDGTMYEATAQNLAMIGMSAVEYSIQDAASAGSNYVLTADNLVSVYTDDEGKEQEISWSWSAQAVNGYTFEQNGNTWYYLANGELTFYLDFNVGTKSLSADEIAALLSSFSLYNDTESSGTSAGTLGGLLAEGKCEITYTYETDADGSMRISGALVTVKNVPAYTTESKPLTYWTVVSENKATIEGSEDYYAATYDNADVAGHGTNTSMTYSGGTVTLTLKGTTSYAASKYWLDSQDEDAKRPAGTYYLYRYRAGESYEKAAAVRDVNGKTVTATVVSDKSDGYSTTIVFTYPDENGETVTTSDNVLEKYDAEGYEYIYVVLEVLDFSNTSYSYVQRFGVADTEGGVDENGSAVYKDIVDDGTGTLTEVSNTSGTREGAYTGNPYVYNGATLTNTLVDTVSTSVVKVWNTAAYASELTDVSVTLTLQKRLKTTDEDGNTVWGEWTDTGTTKVLEGFGSTVSVAVEVDGFARYDDLGNEIQYRWIESAISQSGTDDSGNDIDTAFTAKDEKSSEDGTSSTANASFQLWQHGETSQYRYIQYTSVSETIEEDGNVSTRITNSIADTVEYTLEKIWRQSDTEYEQTDLCFVLYRMDADKSLLDVSSSDPYLTFRVNIETLEVTLVSPDEAPNGVTWDASATKTDSGYIFTVYGLNEYDDEGAKYEYVMLEQIPDDVEANFGPSYIHEKILNDYGDYDYKTTITNSPGSRTFVFVNKSWTDDSDLEHRENVYVNVYGTWSGENDDEHEQGTVYLIETVELTAENNWTVDVTTTNYSDIYIVEIKVGDSTDVADKQKEDLNYNEETGVYESPLNAGVGDTGYYFTDFDGDYHRYEVTYGTGTINGINTYIVSNRRLGYVNLTAEKTWNDGAGDGKQELQEALDAYNENMEENAKLGLYMYLDWDENYSNANAENYEITRGGSYTDENNETHTDGDGIKLYLGWEGIEDNKGNGAASIQPLLISGGADDSEGGDDSEDNETTDTFYFWHLKKYDGSGVSVHYTVREVWMAGGEIVDLSDLLDSASGEAAEALQTLKSLWSEYEIEINSTYTDYVEVPDADVSARDEQDVTVSNTRTGTKSVKWHVTFDDAHAYDSGNRPDVTVTIYRLVYDENGNATGYETVSVTTIETDREESEDGSTTATWSITASGLPKYDEYGNEITYYAVQNLATDASQFDYIPVEYYYTEADKAAAITDDNYAGNLTTNEDKTTTGDENGTPLLWEITGSGYALVEGGTFYNAIENDITFTGKKIWASIPSAFANENLPQTSFALIQGDDPETGTSVASLTVVDWTGSSGGGSYTFTIPACGTYTFKGGKLYIEIEEKVYYLTENAGASEDESRIGWYAANVSTVGDEPDANGASTPLESLEGVTLLPKYDSYGTLYTYTLTETGMTGESGSELDNLSIYSETGTYYIITNTYDSPATKLKVKKTLNISSLISSLPDGETLSENDFPTIYFRVTRSYEAGGEIISDSDFAYKWIALNYSEIYNAYQKAAEDNNFDGSFDVDGYLEGLEVYAPNGSPYIYTIVETAAKNSSSEGGFEGYDTYLSESEDSSDVGEEDDDVYIRSNISLVDESEDRYGVEYDWDSAAADAVYTNTYNPSSVSLTFTKTWDDQTGAFGTRPKQLTFYVTRLANAQSAQSNAIEEELIGTITWTLPIKADGSETSTGSVETTINKDINGTDILVTVQVKDDGSYAFTISGLDNAASNGVAWSYIVYEAVENSSGYFSTGAASASAYEICGAESSYVTLYKRAAASSASAEGTSYLAEDFTNSIESLVRFRKYWQDGSGNNITVDTYGYTFTIKWELQVRVVPLKEDDEEDKASENEWKAASEYFTDEQKAAIAAWNSLDDTTQIFTPEREGNINDTSLWNTWSSSYKVPDAAISNGTVSELQYRYVEKMISYTTSDGIDVTLNLTSPADNYSSSSTASTKELTFENDTRGIISQAKQSVATSTSGTSVQTTSTTDYNIVSLASLSIAKTWYGSSGNQDAAAQSSIPENMYFLVQQSTDKNTWSTAYHFAGEEKEPLTVELSASDDWSASIYGLQKSDGASPVYYRAVELTSVAPSEDAQSDITINGIDYYIVDEGEQVRFAEDSDCWSAIYGEDSAEAGADAFSTTVANYDPTALLCLYITKNVNPMSANREASFDFTLTGETDSDLIRDMDGNVLQELKTTITVTSTGGATEVSATDCLPYLCFTLEDLKTYDAEQKKYSATFTYLVNETQGSAGGYTYSNESYMIEVSLVFDVSSMTEAAKGIQASVTVKKGEDQVCSSTATAGSDMVTQITAGTSSGSDITFTNSYAASGSLILEATKTLTTTETVLQADQFEFTLTGNDNAPMPEGSENGSITVKNGADGSISFGTINYTQDDLTNGTATYTYTVKEVIPSDAVPNSDGTYTKDGVTYSAAGFTVTVVLTDNGDGTLNVETSYSKGESDTVQAMTFTNVYEANGEANISATKSLTGRALETEQFEFTLTAENGAPMPEAAGTESSYTVKNDASGNVSFGNIKYTKSGTYTYTITEVVPSEVPSGYTYDSASCKVTVTVTDSGDGTLSTSVAYAKADGTAVDKAEFTNKYEASGSVTLSATKTLTTNETKLQADQFEFTLSDSSGNTLQTKKNDASGNIAFDAISYTQDDIGKTYTYTVKETKGTASGYTYDETEYTVTVAISDNGDGTLKVETSYSKGGSDTVEAMTFTNVYEANGEANISAAKTLTGRTLEAEQFEFTLTADDNAPMPEAAGTENSYTVKNDASGNVSFGNIKYTKSGTYTYTITEVVPSEVPSGYTYDSASCKVTVTVTDSGDGTLSTSVAYAKADGTAVDKAEFTNKYEASGSLVLEGTKTMKSGSLSEFSFKLEDENGNVLQTVANDTSTGKFAFEALEFSQDDLINGSATFTYTVSEVVPSDTGNIKYDPTVYTVTVTVTDSGDGTLKIEASYAKDGEDPSEITFENEVIPSEGSGGGTKTGDSTHLWLWIVLMILAAAGICAGVVYGIKRRSKS